MTELAGCAMVVTIICDVLGKENNGSTIAANNLIKFLKSQGHDVRVVCADREKSGESGYYIVPTRNFLCFNKYVASNGVALAKPDETVIRSAICGSDIVHVMFPFALGIAGAKMAKDMHIPVTAGFHMLAENFTAHLRLDKNELASRLTYEHFNRLYKNCDAIHFPTAYLREVYERMFGKTNGYVISNGVNDIFKPKNIARTDDEIRILTVGRYSKEKAQSVLIDAAKLSRYKDKIRLIFAGSGPMKDELERRAQALTLPAVFGFYSRADMTDIINDADLYVHSAQIEAEGISCLEAMACGTVPIISDSEKCATKAYALTDKSLFAFGNARDLADRIDWWLDNPQERLSYGKKYADYAASNFDQTECMKRMETMLLQTVEGYADGRGPLRSQVRDGGCAS